VQRIRHKWSKPGEVVRSITAQGAQPKAEDTGQA
ncbi:carbonic anhydrase, partial [Mycobacterium tuberculosis]